MAFIHGEDGKATVRAALSKRAAIGVASIEPLTEADCVTVARLRATTRPLGLSLADRACLTLAKRLGVPALTTDRAWADADTGAEIQLVR